MPLLTPGGAFPKPALQHLSLVKRLVFTGCTLLVAFGAVSVTHHPEVLAPLHLAPGRAPISALEAADVVPRFSESWVTPPHHRDSAHSSAICALPSGDMLAVWYGGSREGAADVALFTARLPRGSVDWTAPVSAVDRASAEEELDRMIKKVGNAVVFPDRAGSLWMVYVTVSVGGWSGSALNVKTSQDEGRTWGPSQRLTLNPFFNVSSLVRNKPIYATDGRIGLPVYHELAVKYPQMLWLTPGPGGTVADYRIRSLASEAGRIQPALVPLGENRVLMMLRNRGGDHTVHTAYSEDNGWTWSEAAATQLPNPDSAVDAVRLRDGRILVVYNDAVQGRENLRLAVSGDQGRTWRVAATLEETAQKEFSYPNLAVDQQGRIHLTYTWHRERIKHVAFNVAWLDRRPAEATSTGQ